MDTKDSVKHLQCTRLLTRGGIKRARKKNVVQSVNSANFEHYSKYKGLLCHIKVKSAYEIFLSQNGIKWRSSNLCKEKKWVYP